ncbi:MAG: EscU/YscU/HrcU family type III secretion system export apparatus switch protein [Archangium sp.]|nr:EscU/YscU/HrcU family type III secretion system export apparatus switch protein [Archangium sp.]
MSDESDDEARTEAPSERRLQQAFEQGDIALSNEVVTTGAFIIGVIALLALASILQAQLVRVISTVTTLSPSTPFGSLPSILMPLLVPAAAVLAACAVGATGLTFAQTKGHLWLDRPTPDLSRVFSMGRLGQLFSKDFLIDLGISVLKVSIVAWACWGVLRNELLTVGKLSAAAPGDSRPPAGLPADLLEGLFSALWKICIRGLGLLAAFAAANFALTRWRYTKKHRMTKEELKREMREDEGDPMMRGARKRKHREMVKRNAVAETKQADVLLVNPTHIAIAIRYRKEDGGAPRVLAKGKGVLAEAMRDAARSNAIPIVQDIPLARLLYKKVKVGGVVPADTYKAVAAILAFVYRLTGKTKAA